MLKWNFLAKMLRENKYNGVLTQIDKEVWSVRNNSFREVLLICLVADC